LDHYCTQFYVEYTYHL